VLIDELKCLSTIMMLLLIFFASVVPVLSPTCSFHAGAVKDCRTLKAAVVTPLPEWYSSLHSTPTATALYNTTLIAMYTSSSCVSSIVYRLVLLLVLNYLHSHFPFVVLSLYRQAMSVVLFLILLCFGGIRPPLQCKNQKSKLKSSRGSVNPTGLIEQNSKSKTGFSFANAQKNNLLNVKLLLVFTFLQSLQN
jgi:hypothetical protein